MPSLAFTSHLQQLLEDAIALGAANRDLRGSGHGRRATLAALNRAAVVLCVSAWEAYVEEVVREAVAAIRPPGPSLGTWPALTASARSAIGRFNTPNTDQVRVLVSDAIGLADVQTAWAWRGCPPAQARARLQVAMNLRHEIAHGVNPRPPVETRYTTELLDFVRRLALCTDDALRAYLVETLGVPDPWPP